VCRTCVVFCPGHWPGLSLHCVPASLPVCRGPGLWSLRGGPQAGPVQKSLSFCPFPLSFCPLPSCLSSLLLPGPPEASVTFWSSLFLSFIFSVSPVSFVPCSSLSACLQAAWHVWAQSWCAPVCHSICRSFWSPGSQKAKGTEHLVLENQRDNLVLFEPKKTIKGRLPGRRPEYRDPRAPRLWVIQCSDLFLHLVNRENDDGDDNNDSNDGSHHSESEESPRV
jgi:hypothetical protein